MWPTSATITGKARTNQGVSHQFGLLTALTNPTMMISMRSSPAKGGTTTQFGGVNGGSLLRLRRTIVIWFRLLGELASISDHVAV
jgi:hypothetical protein